MKARADAVGELEAAGTFEDLTSLGPPQDDIDRQLEQLGRDKRRRRRTRKDESRAGYRRPDRPSSGQRGRRAREASRDIGAPTPSLTTTPRPAPGEN